MKSGRCGRWGLFILICLLVVACRGIGPAGPAREFDEQALDVLESDIVAGVYGEIHSLLIWADDIMVREVYFRGSEAEDLHTVYSVTKSVTSAAIGQALAAGDIAALDTPLFDFFPEQADDPGRDARKTAITLEDLLTMRAGFAWDEFSTIYGDATNDATRLARSDDWMQFVLDRPMSHMPSEVFIYNSGVSMLLSAVLQHSSGQPADRAIIDHLFTPLGITVWVWDKTPQGYANTGWGLHLRPADMLTFGRLYLQEGQWQGEEVIPADWIERSTRALTPAGEGYEYGYQWWRFTDDHFVVDELRRNDLYFAWGFGGQFIFVVPHLEMVVVATAENFSDSAQFFPALEAIFAAIE